MAKYATVNQIIEHLQETYPLEDKILVDIWCQEDVLSHLDSQLEEQGLDEAQQAQVADAVLDTVATRFDANFGVNWDVLQTNYDSIKDEL